MSGNDRPVDGTPERVTECAIRRLCHVLRAEPGEPNVGEKEGATGERDTEARARVGMERHPRKADLLGKTHGFFSGTVTELSKQLPQHLRQGQTRHLTAAVCEHHQ
eukprot:Lithocolla_globosa_v1_NODE_3173_length_1741_cov_5.908660.p2 type:complete len:106 gc:universal NODE_3173_length_1741_cov_5.908660:827-1144(+)